MIGEKISSEADRFLRRDRAVCPDVDDELVVVGRLSNARAFDVIVHATNRRMDRVDRNVAERQIAVGVAVGNLIAAAALQTRLELQRAFLRKRGDVRRRIEDLDVRIGFEIGGRDDTRATLFEIESLRSFAVHLERDLLEVEDDISHVFNHALQRRELVQNALDTHRGDRGSFNRGEENAPKRVADRGAESAFERLGNETPVVRSESLGIVIELVRFLEI